MKQDKLYQETLPDGRTQYRYRYKDLSGRWRRVSCIKENNTRRSYNEALYELQMRAVDASFSRLRCSGALRLYLADKKRVLRPQTLLRNESECVRVNDALGDPWLDTLTVISVKRAIGKISEKNCTYNERLARYKAFLSWCYQNELIKENLSAKLVPLPDKKKERIQDKYLEPEELEKLLDSIRPPMWYHLTLFLVLSGLRIGEAIALTMDDVGEKYITVNKTYSLITGEIGDTKTDTSSREVYIQPELRKVIDEYMLFRESDSPYFFPGKNGVMCYGSYNKYLREVSRKVLGRTITPHALRHTCASLFLASGVSVDTISRRLGHSDSRITKDIYIHLTEKLKAQDENSLNFTIILPSQNGSR